MKELQSFKPIIDKKSRILILGSMPGKMSLEKDEYYGNPRNHFWKIMFELFERPMEEDYKNKVEFILNHNIALWDVIENCEREGSLDSNIKNEKANDIINLLENYPNIGSVVFNGAKAFQTYKKLIGFDPKPSLDYIKLPSTSPIPGRTYKTYEDKFEAWKEIKNHLEKSI
ncbi:DNA-deoxyinosine glycosylase [Gudongella sp. DL1XJH-153]|uniref:DNA-deoxyinosine glycosylase n=1 Tax=Gudongella sp. DL1XJH-153 TaxID=3409804 RepID=UPI003BB50AB4